MAGYPNRVSKLDCLYNQLPLPLPYPPSLKTNQAPLSSSTSQSSPGLPLTTLYLLTTLAETGSPANHASLTNPFALLRLTLLAHGDPR